MFETQTFPILQ